MMTIIQRARRDVVGWPLRGSAGAALIAARLSPAGSRGGDDHGGFSLPNRIPTRQNQSRPNGVHYSQFTR